MGSRGHINLALTILGMGLSGRPLHAATGQAAGIIRGIYAEPGAAVKNRLWTSYGAGYEEDRREKHSGQVSLRCTNKTDQEAHGALQSIRFDQAQPRPIVIAGWAKLEGVTGPADYHCSVYLDLTLQDGTSWPMKIAAFDPARTGWQYAEQTYVPPAPLDSARVHVFLRQRQGTAWFDDLYVGEILDDQGTRSPNLLIDPSFEGHWPDETSPRDRFFRKLQEIGCNAFHFYRGVEWEKVMGLDPTRPPTTLPAIAIEDPLLDFVRDAHRRGFKVWLTVGLGLPPIENVQSKEFPFWPCVNNRWGQAYSRALAYFAQYGVDGIGLVPDEWNYDTSAAVGLAKHPDPEVAAFYAHLPPQCDCEVCRARFRQQTEQNYPDVRHLWSTTDPVWAKYIQFRYDSTTAWMRRSVEAVKRVNPKIATDTMICVLPVCSDDRLATGAAWDQIGVATGLDCLQTDPYIQLHNYLGDSTHYYPTETALHLTAANWKGRSGVTLEACRLYDYYRDKEPVEVYGSALSCLVHGATEFFWWHFSYLNGEVQFVDPQLPSRRLAAVHQVMREMEPYVLEARVPGDVLVLYSRASEDTWDWLARTKIPPQLLGPKPNPKRGFLAHRNVLYWLLRRGYPFQMTFLDHPDPQRLRASKVLIVPFPFSLKEAEVQTLAAQARIGKTVLLLSELSPVDEWGQPLDSPRLARLFSNQTVNPFTEGPVVGKVGPGQVVFLGGDLALRLFEETPPQKDPQGTVPLLAFDEARSRTLEKALLAALGKPISLFAQPPVQDVEVCLLEGRSGQVLLLINWDLARPASVQLRLPPGKGSRLAEGYAIRSDASAKPLRATCPGGHWTVELAPQEARLLRFLPAAGRNRRQR